METLTISPTEIKNLLIEKSKSLGFQELRIAPYRKLNSESKNYQEWLARGFNASMDWMLRNIDKREDIALVLPNAKSIIVTAFSYYTGNIHPNELDTDIGKISRYAWGSDYHEIIKDKLQILSNEIQFLIPDSNSKCYVDTGPILEKQWAEIAGLGWQGKNSLILNKNIGSYFFIGIIISDLELPYDDQVKDYCGTCNKCIVACPTNAIVGDKIVDSNKCISYWTIEAKPHVNIPESISQDAKNWIYGCDICQEVCPWNRNKPIFSNEPLFASRVAEGSISKNDIDNMIQDDFSRKFKNSPIKRLKISGLKRNSDDILH